MDGRILGLDSQLLADTGIVLIAMFVLFILLSYLLFNPARNLIQKRKDYIREQLEDAAKNQEEAKRLKDEYDAKISQAHEDAAEIVADARKSALNQEKEIVGRANEEAVVIRKRAEKEMELEKNKMRDDVKNEMVQVASAMAGKFVEVSMDEKKQAEMIEETLKEIGEETWQDYFQRYMAMRCFSWPPRRESWKR